MPGRGASSEARAPALRTLAGRSARHALSRPLPLLVLAVALLAADLMLSAAWDRLPRGLHLALVAGRWTPLLALLVATLFGLLALAGGALVTALSSPLSPRRVPASTAVVALGLVTAGLGAFSIASGVALATRLSLAGAGSLRTASVFAPLTASGVVLLFFAFSVTPLACWQLAHRGAPLLDALGSAVLAIFARPARSAAVAAWTALATLLCLGVFARLWSSDLLSGLPLHVMGALLTALLQLFAVELWGLGLSPPSDEGVCRPCR